MLKSNKFNSMLKVAVILVVLASITMLSKGNECNEDTEVAYKKLCYKLIPLQSLIDHVADNASTMCIDISNEQCSHYSRTVAQTITSIYSGNINQLPDDYQFGYLSSNLDKNVLYALVDRYRSSLAAEKANQKRTLSILGNYYEFGGHAYIEGQSDVGEMPNVMLHEDLMANDQQDLCLYANHTANRDDQSFSFFLGNCDKKMSFMCVKATRTSVKENLNPAERCSHYNRVEPGGGSWFPCDEESLESTVGLTMFPTKSHKCCLFNIHWKQTFSNAQHTCSNLNAHLYSLNTLNYRQFLKTYASYLVTNFSRLKATHDIFSFWTSCQRTNSWKSTGGVWRAQDLNCHEPIKNKEYFRELLNSHGDQKEAIDHGLFIRPLHVVSNTSFKNSWFNLGLTNKLLSSPLIPEDFSHESIAKLARDSMIIVRRKPLRFVNKYKCFAMDIEQAGSLLKVRMPFVDTCYNLTIYKNSSVVSGLMHESNEAEIPRQIISGLLNSIGIIEFASSSIPSMFRVLSMNEFMPDLTALRVRQFISKTSVLSINRFGTLSKTLLLDCANTATDVKNLLKQCQTLSQAHSCHFTCPNDCNSPRQVVDNVWQIRPFEYLFNSSICQAAYHSNILAFDSSGSVILNQLDLNRSISKAANEFTILNNQIHASIWPSQFGDDKESQRGFRFEGDVKIKKELVKIEAQQGPVMVLVKAVFSPGEPQQAIVYHSKDLPNKEFRLKAQDINAKRTGYKISSINKDSSMLSWSFNHPTSIYWDLFSDFSFSVKFPINVLQEDPEMLQSGQDHVLRTPNNEINIHHYGDREKWHWYYNNVNTGIGTDSDLFLNFTRIADIENHFVIVRPGSPSQHIFTRVFFNQTSSHECLNHGIFKNGKCFCYHGYNGRTCQESCEQNKFGPGCELTCPNGNCKGFLLCVSDPIGCSCLPGYTGFDCNTLVHSYANRDACEDNISYVIPTEKVISESVKMENTSKYKVFESPLTLWMITIAMAFYIAIVCRMKEKGFKLVYTVEEFEHLICNSSHTNAGESSIEDLKALTF